MSFLLLSNAVKLSKWAKTHERSARFVIFICQVLLFLLTYTCSRILGNVIPAISMGWANGMVAIGVSTWVLYELRFAKVKMERRYFTQKLVGIVVLVTGLFGLFVLFSQPVSSISRPQDNVYAGFKIKKTLGEMSHVQNRLQPVKTSDTSVGVKILLVFLVVIMSVALACLISIIACAVACNGAELLAYIILAVGFPGDILLSFFLIRGILRRR